MARRRSSTRSAPSLARDLVRDLDSPIDMRDAGTGTGAGTGADDPPQHPPLPPPLPGLPVDDLDALAEADALESALGDSATASSLVPLSLPDVRQLILQAQRAEGLGAGLDAPAEDLVDEAADLAMSTDLLDDPVMQARLLLPDLPDPGLSPSLREEVRTLALSHILSEIETRDMEEVSERGLRTFVRWAWPILEPATAFVDGYHIDAVAAHLAAITRGELFDLVITMPPRMGKSLQVGVLWPCWEWGPANQPHLKALFNTYRIDLSIRDSGKRRLLMNHREYTSRWGHRFTLGRDKFRADNSVRYENNHAGFHLATSVEGGNTGEGGDRILADDPHNIAEIHSEKIREGVVQWWSGTMTSRRNKGSASARIVVQQRGHMRDLAGVLIEQGQYTHLNLPNEYDPKRRCFTRWWADPRTQPGQLLAPGRVSAKDTADLRISLGEADYEAQYQQNPAPPDGLILKVKGWRYWVPPFHELAHKADEYGRPILVLPRVFDSRLHSWDMTFKKTVSGSYVCGQAWARRRTQAYLLGMFRERVGIVDTIAAVEDLSIKFPADAIYIEGKANGPAVIDTLRQRIPLLIEADVDASKEGRAHASAPYLEAGHFALPHPSIAPWVQQFIDETKMFPNGTHNDITDTFTQATRYLFIRASFSTSHIAPGQDHGL